MSGRGRIDRAAVTTTATTTAVTAVTAVTAAARTTWRGALVAYADRCLMLVIAT